MSRPELVERSTDRFDSITLRTYSSYFAATICCEPPQKPIVLFYAGCYCAAGTTAGLGI